jgi:predicted MFS family arabinose efflux permease
MNLAAATQDVAVDGLAVDLLPPEDLGRGNAAQVVGFKVGMLLGGGLLLWASAWIGVEGLFLGMAALALLGAGATWAFREPAPAPGTAPPAPAEVARRVWQALRRPGTGWVLAFIATYKLGETLIDVMFKPFLVDQGYTAAQLGLWVGSWGLGCSILGSVLGGLLASRTAALTAVGVAALLRVGPLAAEWALAVFGAPAWAVIATTCAEHLLGGALTTAMFAFMMARVDRTVGGTHFTALAVVEVLGKAPAGLLSGLLAQALGYPALFGLGTALSVAFLALLVPLRGRG